MGTSHKSEVQTDTNKNKEEAKNMDTNEKTKLSSQHNVYHNTSNDKDSGTNKSIDTEPSNNTDNKTDMGTYTGTQSDTYNLLDELVTPSEVMVRHVCYLNQEQSAFVKDMAKQLTKRNKGKKVTESEIFRTAIDYLMKAAKEK